jgi:transposase
MTMKVHAICDEKGRAVTISIMAENIDDFDGARILWICGQFPPKKSVTADCRQEAQWIRHQVHSHRMEACRPLWCTMKIPASYFKPLYAFRDIVEHFFVKLKDWRLIATRYDHFLCNFLASMLIASSFITFLLLWGLTLPKSEGKENFPRLIANHIFSSIDRNIWKLSRAYSCPGKSNGEFQSWDVTYCLFYFMIFELFHKFRYQENKN